LIRPTTSVHRGDRGVLSSVLVSSSDVIELVCFSERPYFSLLVSYNEYVAFRL